MLFQMLYLYYAVSQSKHLGIAMLCTILLNKCSNLLKALMYLFFTQLQRPIDCSLFHVLPILYYIIRITI